MLLAGRRVLSHFPLYQMFDSHYKKDAVIIGGGISGLAIAYRLQRAGLNILLVEKSARVGGALLTEEIDGFLVDCGPNSTLETSPEIGHFMDEIGLQGRRIYANPSAKKRFILKNGNLLALPMNPFQFLACRLFSIQAKLRLLAEPFIPAAPEELEETIAQFVRRRLGKEFLDYAINPFVAGIYAGDPARLSVRSAAAKIYALEKNYGSLVKGAIKVAKQRQKMSETSKTKARLFSFQNGMTELANALAEILANSIQKRSILDRVELPGASGDFYTLSISQKTKRIKIAAKSLIFATPAHVTAGYLKSIDKSLSAKLQKITYPPVAVVFSGFKKQVPCRPLDGFGFLVPRVENRRILGTIWNSAIFPNRAPEGGFCLTTFIGGMRQPDLPQLDDRELGELVFDELKDVMQLQEKPDVLRIKRWEKAIPQYELGHQNSINEIEKLETEHPGLFISGNFRNGISVGDCIVQSKSLSSKIVDYCTKCVPESEVA